MQFYCIEFCFHSRPFDQTLILVLTFEWHIILAFWYLYMPVSIWWYWRNDQTGLPTSNNQSVTRWFLKGLAMTVYSYLFILNCPLYKVKLSLFSFLIVCPVVNWFLISQSSMATCTQIICTSFLGLLAWRMLIILLLKWK